MITNGSVSINLHLKLTLYAVVNTLNGIKDHPTIRIFTFF